MVVVRASMASEIRGSGLLSTMHSHRRGPVRTCIGCRQRSAAAELLRVVAAPIATQRMSADLVRQSNTAEGSAGRCVVPDPRHRASGRGAWVHPDVACVELAQRRRAFARALHVSTATDPMPVRLYLDSIREAGSTEGSNTEDSNTGCKSTGTTPASGTPQEMKSYGHSMKRQQ